MTFLLDTNLMYLTADMVEDQIPFKKSGGVNLPEDYKWGESYLAISRRKIG